jgi:hypothetical protein
MHVVLSRQTTLGRSGALFRLTPDAAKRYKLSVTFAQRNVVNKVSLS